MSTEFDASGFDIDFDEPDAVVMLDYGKCIGLGLCEAEAPGPVGGAGRRRPQATIDVEALARAGRTDISAYGGTDDQELDFFVDSL